MEKLIAPDKLRARILTWADEEIRANTLLPQSAKILERVLYQGKLPRDEIAPMFGVTPRHARRYVEPLTERGVLVSEGLRAPFTLAFPATLAPRWMPGLFPEQKI